MVFCMFSARIHFPTCHFTIFGQDKQWNPLETTKVYWGLTTAWGCPAQSTLTTTHRPKHCSCAHPCNLPNLKTTQLLRRKILSSSDPRPDTLFWHSFWHTIYKYVYIGGIFWHSIWRSFWHVLWHSFWHSTWHLFCHTFWHICWHSFWHLFWHSFWHAGPKPQAPDLSGRGWSPAVPTEICRSPLRSGTAAVPTEIWSSWNVHTLWRSFSEVLELVSCSFRKRCYARYKARCLPDPLCPKKPPSPWSSRIGRQIT